MEIIKIGLTVADKTGDVQLIMQGDMPDDCVVIFIRTADYEEAKRLLEGKK